VPSALARLHHQVDWGDRAAITELFGEHGGEIAVILVAADYARLPRAREFYAFLRSLADTHGALLAYDEMVTGFRVAIGGMAEYTGVLPDLSVYGKGIANGMPLSVYAGRREVLSVLDRGDVVVTSTYGGETLSLAAAVAVMTAFRDEDVVEALRRRGSRFSAGLNRLFEERKVDAELRGHPTCPQLVTDDPELARAILRGAFRHGVSLYPVVYVNRAHGDTDIDEALARLDRSLAEVGRRR
jgi:glutamate-1-semialdehyde 2,1-aminomutase